MKRDQKRRLKKSRDGSKSKEEQIANVPFLPSTSFNLLQLASLSPFSLFLSLYHLINMSEVAAAVVAVEAPVVIEAVVEAVVQVDVSAQLLLISSSSRSFLEEGIDE